MALHQHIAAEAVHIVAAGHKAAAHRVAGRIVVVHMVGAAARTAAVRMVGVAGHIAAVRMVGVEIHTELADHIVAVHIVVVHMVGAAVQGAVVRTAVRMAGVAGHTAAVRIAAAFGLGLHTW